METNKPTPQTPIIPSGTLNVTNSSTPPVEETPIAVDTIPVPADLHKKGGKKIYFIFIGLLIFLLTIGFLAYWQITLPQRTAKTIIQNFIDAKSYQAAINLPDSPNNVSITMAYQTVPVQISQLTMKMPIDAASQTNFILKFLSSKQDIYTTVDDNEAQQTIDVMTQSEPTLKNLKTYHYVQNLLVDKKWLHANLDSLLKKYAPKEAPKKTLSPEELKQLANNVSETIMVRNFSQNFMYQGKKTTRVTFGFNKQKLLLFIDSLKNKSFNLTQAEINDLKNSINQMQDLDSDLMEIIADQNNIPMSFSFYIPNSWTAPLNDQVQKQTDIKTNNPFVNKNTILPLIDSFMPKSEAHSKMTKMFTIVFSQFNVDQHLAIPANTIEFEDVEKTIQNEWPTIMSMMDGTYQNTSTTLAPGSPEWKAEFLRKWHEAGLPNPKNEAEYQSLVPVFCQKYPEMCK